ncbi:MAG TPA: hypothetical protein VEN30_15970 [Paraburkholderia sp.]|nr:hypothetical protein [Paraburkholderia sp.]
MSYQDVDKEIAHLERIFGLISTQDRIPLSYWHNRLRMFHWSSLMPTQRARVARLEATLRAIEKSAAEAVDTEPALGVAGTRS